jgi:hypothetical protein
MREAIHPLPQYAFMGWCLVKPRDNFTFYLYLILENDEQRVIISVLVHVTEPGHIIYCLSAICMLKPSVQTGFKHKVNSQEPRIHPWVHKFRVGLRGGRHKPFPHTFCTFLCSSYPFVLLSNNYQYYKISRKWALILRQWVGNNSISLVNGTFK